MLVAAVLLGACGQSYEEKKRLSREERARLAREDSAALKVAVMPTIDCLPLYVARQSGLFGTLGADVRLKSYKAAMDCGEALAGGRVEVAVADVVRVQWLKSRGVKLAYLTATGAYWQLITNRNARIKEAKQMDDKMMAMTRWSALDMMGDHVVDSVGLKPERVFRIQVNDVALRLQMLLNSQMDALWLPEPQATAARMRKNVVLADSRKLGMRLGAIAFRDDLTGDTARQRQMDVLVKAYNMACDSISKNGMARYRNLIAECCGVSRDVAAALPKDLRFEHIAQPGQADVDRADKWLNSKKGDNGDK